VREWEKERRGKGRMGCEGEGMGWEERGVWDMGGRLCRKVVMEMMRE
jgi:hypothetical protein